MFMLLFFVWGWVILLVLAAVLAAKLPWKAGLPLAGGLVLLALPWFWAMRSATLGIRHASVISPAGYEAWFEHQGFWTYTVHVRRSGRTFDMGYHPGQDVPPVQRVRWINDSLLAIDRAGRDDFVYDLDIYEYVTWENVGERGPKPDFDPNATRPWLRAPLSGEEAFFTDE